MHVKRFLAMVVLLLGGVGSLLYGSFFHGIMVEEEKEREISIAVPTMSEFGDMPFEPGGGAMADDINPFDMYSGSGESSENPFENPPEPSAPPVPFGMRFEKVTETYVESSEEWEPTIVWEVTIGGVMRMANGQLKRTYSGQPPALCPT